MSVRKSGDKMIATYGKGSVGNCFDIDKTMLIIHSIPEGEIDREISDYAGKTVDDIGNCIILKFDNIKSIDVVISQLEVLKDELLKKEVNK